jgi:hypothetical protein
MGACGAAVAAPLRTAVAWHTTGTAVPRMSVPYQTRLLHAVPSPTAVGIVYHVTAVALCQNKERAPCGWLTHAVAGLVPWT